LACCWAHSVARWLPWALLACVVALAAWGEVDRRDRAAQAAGLIVERDRLQGIVDAAQGQVEEAETTIVVVDSAADAAIAAAKGEATAAQGRARTAELQLRDLLVGNAEAVRLLEQLYVAHEAERQQWLRQELAYQQKLAARDSALVAYRLANGALQQALANERDISAYWEREANPPFSVKLWKGLPGFALTGAGAYAGAALGEEVGALVGASGAYLLGEILDVF
jgi:hypothetical protein